MKLPRTSPRGPRVHGGDGACPRPGADWSRSWISSPGRLTPAGRSFPRSGRTCRPAGVWVERDTAGLALGHKGGAGGRVEVPAFSLDGNEHQFDGGFMKTGAAGPLSLPRCPLPPPPLWHLPQPMQGSHLRRGPASVLIASTCQQGQPGMAPAHGLGRSPTLLPFCLFFCPRDWRHGCVFQFPCSLLKKPP